MSYVCLVFILYITSFSRKIILYRLNVFICFFYFASAYCFNYDWINYRFFYENVLNDNFFKSILNSGFEPGFVFVSYVIKSLHLDYQWVVIFLNAISFIFFNSAINKINNKNCALFLFVSFFGFFLIAEQIRQGVALAIGLKAIELFLRQKKKSALLIAFLAIFFHVSAIMLIVMMYILYKFKSEYKPVTLMVFFILGMAAPLLFSIVLTHPQIFSFYPLLQKKLIYYSNQDLGNESGILTLGLIPNLMLLILISYYCLKSYGKRLSQPSLLAAAFIIQSKIIALFYRFSHYGVLYFIFFFDEVFHDKKLLGWYRFLLLTVILMFGLKPLSTELYRSSLFDYHFYWTNNYTPNEIKNSRCQQLFKTYPTSTYTRGTCS